MVVGKIIVATCYGDADIPVELLGKGPRPGTAWVKALNGLQPFTKISHGGPYQDDTSVVPLLYVRDVHIEKEPISEYEEETDVPDTNVTFPAPDWFLESSYEDRTYLE